MSEMATGQRLSAVAWNRGCRPASTLVVSRRGAACCVSSRSLIFFNLVFWPKAERRKPMAQVLARGQNPSSPLAKLCTVTSSVTSVMNRGLADSVLIRVGKVVLGQRRRRRTLAQEVLREPLHCAFQGGACIQ